MRATVVVVNYNGGQGIAENLRVVAREAERADAELLVVDNRSTDGSADSIRNAVPTVRLVEEPENRGYATAVNRGLREARGETIVVLNSDLRPRPGALAALVSAVETERGCALVGGVLVDARGRESTASARVLPRIGDILREGLFLPPRRVSRGGAGGEQGARERAATGTSAGAAQTDPATNGVERVPAVSGAAMAVHRENLVALGPMDEEYFLYNEDLEWCRRAHAKGLGVAVARGAVFDHEGGASTVKSEVRAFAARVLADFQYFCEGEGVPPEAVRRRWRARLVLRSSLYALDAALGSSSRRPRSRRRSAMYHVLASELAHFRWSRAEDMQNAHPSRLVDLPGPSARADGDVRRTILQITPNMEYGGAQRLIESIVTGPLSSRYRFEILCLTHRGEIGEELTGRGVPVHCAGIQGWRSLRDWRRAANYARLFDVDLVHAHLLPADIAAGLAFGRRLPWISTKHSIDRSLSSLARVVERFVLRRARLVLAVGDSVAQAKAYLGPPGMLPPVVQSPPAVAVTADPAPLFVPGRPVRLSAVGRLHAVKRVDLFLETAAELERRAPGRFAFRVVGDGPERERLEKLASELGLTGRVEFRGSVHDVAAELDDTDLVLLLSDYEGLALTVLEGLARGRVPVVRRVPGTEEALPSSLADCVVDSAQPSEIADRILAISDEPERFTVLASEARDRLSAREDYASVMGRAYEEVLGGGRPSRPRVLHLITRLIVGGAQENTIASVARVDPGRYDSQLWIGPQTGAEGSLLNDARSRGLIVRVLPHLVREVNPWKDAMVIFQLVRLLKRERFDVLHTHSSKAGIVGRLAARIAGVPHVVHTVHGWGFHDHMHPAVRGVYIFLEKVFERWTDRLVSVSRRTTTVGLENGIGGADSYRLIRSGIPFERFRADASRRERARMRLDIDSDDIVIGSVGRLSPQKNPLDFVATAAALLKHRDDLLFLYVGDGPLRPKVTRALEDAGVGDRVRLLGLRDDVPDILCAMDIFVLTSLWEGLPRVVPQALAGGVPVVAYNIAGIEEAVIEGRNGFLVPPGDVDELVERIDRLLRDASLLRELGRRAGEEFDESFTEDRMIRDLEALYDEVTDREAAVGGW
jgi:glycosyltransferase involved in cell wall biosynthesis/GT2 family glycosyltransferase